MSLLSRDGATCARHANPPGRCGTARRAVCEAAGAMRRAARRRIASADSVGFWSAAFEAMQCKHQTVLH
ncbi:hypothetical protein C6T58_09265 [Burkholderia multivorans]|nr:hypothetical protein C6Q11_28360 [Burkholderia multivorans]PRG82982.1 hypothetical protein C6T58_09265 [Burkholderia multivorans]